MRSFFSSILSLLRALILPVILILIFPPDPRLCVNRKAVIRLGVPGELGWGRRWLRMSLLTQRLGEREQGIRVLARGAGTRKLQTGF